MDSNLKILLAAWLSGDWDDAELKPALERLRTDESLRASLAEELAMLSQTRAVQMSEPKWLKLEDALGTAEDYEATCVGFETSVMTSLASEKQYIGKSFFHKRPFLTAVLAAAAVVAALMFLPGDLPNQGGPNARDAVSPRADQRLHPSDRINLVSGPDLSAVAVLSQSVSAKWDGDYRPSAGDNLGVGHLILQRGEVQIDFLAGARLLLRAPADIEIRAADEVLIRYGSASCFVTEMGHGFRVLTKEMEVIDLGTSFSIDVKSDGNSEVHVLDGSVAIKSPKGPSLELTEMHAIRMGDDGPENVEYSPDRFPKTSDLRIRLRDIDQRRYESWKAKAKAVSADPSVILHYTFEETDPSALEVHNVATDASRATNGAVIGCRWDEGRWPSKRALVYRNAGDRVLFQVPGAVSAVTFLVWARVDALTQDITSLLMTEHPDRRKMLMATDNKVLGDAMQRRRESTVETVRWELSQYTNNVLFSVGHGMDRSDYDMSAAVHPYTRSSRWGTWACMGVTCDAKKREVIHYLNGDPIGGGQFERAKPLLLDFMELGNFGATSDELKETDGLAQRRFYGAIDELVIANRVFDAAEIKAFWTNGKP